MPNPPDDRHDAGWGEVMRRVVPPVAVSSEAEERTISALRARRLIQPGSLRWWNGSMPRLAAALLLILAGGFIGRATIPGSAPDTGQRFLLLLLEDSTFTGEQVVGHDSIVAEYSAWAGSLADRGVMVMGEELTPDEAVLGTLPEPAGGRRITGFFMIHAPDRDSALAIARSCPHLKYGGTVSVRGIEGGQP